MSSPELRWAGREIGVTTGGAVDTADVSRTARAVAAVLRSQRIDGPARIRLSTTPSRDGSVLAQVNAGRAAEAVRVQVEGPAGFVATIVSERLDRAISRSRPAGPVRRWPDPARPPLTSITGDRPIVRRKRCVLRSADPTTATRSMDALDYDAHLFVDAESGEDALVYWAGPLGVRLARQHLTRLPDAPALTVNPHPAPRLTESDAASRVCRFGLPYVFFTDADSGRGHLLYRRYDGDLAIVQPLHDPEDRS
ncbi:sigma 54 modulation/S30EA ribosomal C-terminal domain-containing protein [Nocardia sp. NPDC058379]|uniref:sigma 54 modulation/S30EA ribosomal C-terminal domain-containing protein n=1 Tax=unclassified Nocardia TaxID=2637762 RepID=UPI00364CEECE